MRVLESTPENRAALLLGLEYLIGISYIEDTEVFKVHKLVTSRLIKSVSE